MRRVEARGRELGAVEVGLGVAGGDLRRGDLRGARHLPAAGDDAPQLEVRHRAREGLVQVAHRVHADPLRRLVERRQRLGERRADALRRRRRRCAAHSLRDRFHLLPDARRGRAHVAHQLAADQIERLDAGRALRRS